MTKLVNNFLVPLWNSAEHAYRPEMFYFVKMTNLIYLKNKYKILLRDRLRKHFVLNPVELLIVYLIRDKEIK